MKKPCLIKRRFRWARTCRLVVVLQSSSSSSFVLDRGSGWFARWKEDEWRKQAAGVSLVPPEKRPRTKDDEDDCGDRRRTNAVRFLMNTLVAHPIPSLIHAFPAEPWVSAVASSEITLSAAEAYSTQGYVG